MSENRSEKEQRQQSADGSPEGPRSLVVDKNALEGSKAASQMDFYESRNTEIQDKDMPAKTGVSDHGIGGVQQP